MRAGIAVQALAEEIQRQTNAREDFLAPTTAMKFTTAADLVLFGDQWTRQWNVSDLAHGQIADRLNIPRAYYERMRTESPSLLAENVNHWFDNTSERRMLRTMDGNVRAFLSSSYRPLDNDDLACAVFPEIAKHDLRIESANITEKHLYIKTVFPRLESEVDVGDPVQWGLVISNSEVGCGALTISPMVFRLVCRNGAIMADRSMKKFHLGGRHDGDPETWNLLRDETRMANDRALWMTIQDMVAAILNPRCFEEVITRLRAAKNQAIENPVSAVERIQKRFGLSNAENDNVLRHLAAGGDLSIYGLSNALTRASQDIASYERATEMERMGGQVIELPREAWYEIKAA